LAAPLFWLQVGEGTVTLCACGWFSPEGVGTSGERVTA